MLSKDDFEIEQFAEIDPDRFPTYQDALDYALTTIDFAVGELKRNCDSDDYVLVIGSSGNYRKDAAILKPYKGGRGDKPLVFSDLAEKFTNKYKRRVIIAENEEAEDVVAYMMQVEYVEKVEAETRMEEVFCVLRQDLLQIRGHVSIISVTLTDLRVFTTGTNEVLMRSRRFSREGDPTNWGYCGNTESNGSNLMNIKSKHTDSDGRHYNTS